MGSNFCVRPCPPISPLIRHLPSSSSMCWDGPVLTTRPPYPFFDFALVVAPESLNIDLVSGGRPRENAARDASVEAGGERKPPFNAHQLADCSRPKVLFPYAPLPVLVFPGVRPCYILGDVCI